MILVDSSVWIEHLRHADPLLQKSLEAKKILVHPFILGELALGHLRSRAQILSLLKNLPQAIVADEEEVLEFIERHSLYGSGIGYVDVHLLISARLTPALLLTQDKHLRAAAEKLNILL